MSQPQTSTQNLNSQLILLSQPRAVAVAETLNWFIIEDASESLLKKYKYEKFKNNFHLNFTDCQTSLFRKISVVFHHQIMREKM